VIASVESNDTSIYLQLGAFKSQEGAEGFLEKMRNQLNDTGKQLKLSSKDGLVRVHIGPYGSESEARNSAESMEGKLGFKPMVNLP
jgi:rare lipoprotein A